MDYSYFRTQYNWFCAQKYFKKPQYRKGFIHVYIAKYVYIYSLSESCISQHIEYKYKYKYHTYLGAWLQVSRAYL